jgi:hypothetical protein
VHGVTMPSNFFEPEDDAQRPTFATASFGGFS